MKKTCSKILNPKSPFPYLKLGFTVMELLVVMGVIIILFTISLAAYNRFNRRQVVEQATRNLESDLRLAQSKAVAQEKPGGWCGTGTLVGYRLRFTSETQYVIEAVCSNSAESPKIIKTVDLPEKIEGIKDTDVLFKVLTKGVDEPTTFILTGYDTIQGEVTVEGGGNIETEEIIEVTPTPIPTPPPGETPTPPPGETPTVPPGTTPTPTPTPTCIPEGGTIITGWPPGPGCCAGLVTSATFEIDEEGVCHALYGGGICTKCGLDGLCGLGEDICNCPEDCSSGPTCLGGTYISDCGEDGCWSFQRHVWADYTPDGCGGEEYDRCDFYWDCLF